MERTVFPLQMGDVKTIRSSVTIYTPEQKKAALAFALAIDLALLQRFSDANEKFAAALRLQPDRGQRQLAENWMHSVENMAQMSEGSKNWLEEHRKLLLE